MNKLVNLIDTLKHKCREMDNVRFTGAIDVVVIEYADGRLSASPFHVRFGHLGSFKTATQTQPTSPGDTTIDKSLNTLEYADLQRVTICVNGRNVDGGVPMMLNEYGQGYFVSNAATNKSISKTASSISFSNCESGEASLDLDRYLQRANTLSSDELKALRLNPGMNNINYLIRNGAYQTSAFIFKWRSDDRLVITDIDGTISKSDLRGHLLPRIGLKNWHHDQIAKLFDAIDRAGYKIIYLSARSIYQSESTRRMLQSIRQDGYSMPTGAILLNPVNLYNAFHSELIDRSSCEFKLNCLNEIKALFAAQSSQLLNNPFHAAFGNRQSDANTYRACGIDSNLIFTVNPFGDLRTYDADSNVHEQLSYSGLCNLVDAYFPPSNSPYI